MVARRLAALGIGLALAGLAYGLFATLRGPRGPREIDRDAVRELFAEHAATSTDTDGERAALARELYMPEEVARQLFLVHSTGQRYDPWCYHAHKPNIHAVVPWKEHPSGEWVYATNGAGLREDEELPEGPIDARVLVTGDSHTEGFCDNRDSFANLLEAALVPRAASLGRSLDVVNAGDGGYSFYNYLGVLEKHLDLAPRVFLVCVYSGNDFFENLLPHRWFEREELPAESAEEAAERVRGTQLDSSAYTQWLRSMLYFRRHPDEVDFALAAAESVLLRAREICAANGIELLVVHLPDPVTGERQAHAERIALLREAFELEERDLETNARLGRALLSRLTARGVACVDLSGEGRPAPPLSYWETDQHLDVEGHAAVAAALEPDVARLLGLD